MSLYLKDVIQETLKPYAINVEVLEMPGSRVISQVNNGQVDGDLSRVKHFKSISDDDTSNYIRVDERIVLIEIVLLTIANKEISRPITWGTINQGNVAFLRGSKTIRQHVDVHRRVALTTNLQVLDLVANERVDSAIMFATVAENLLSLSPEFQKKLVIHRPAVMSFHLYLFLNKKHIQLIPKIKSSLAQLKQSGFLKYTADKYGVAPPLN